MIIIFEKKRIINEIDKLLQVYRGRSSTGYRLGKRLKFHQMVEEVWNRGTKFHHLDKFPGKLK